MSWLLLTSLCTLCGPEHLFHLLNTWWETILSSSGAVVISVFSFSCSLHCLYCWLSMSCVSLSPVRCLSIIYGVFVNLQAECLGMFGVFPWSWTVFWQLVNAKKPPEATAPYLPFLPHLGDLWWLFCRHSCDWQSWFQNVGSSMCLLFVGLVQTQ